MNGDHISIPVEPRPALLFLYRSAAVHLELRAKAVGIPSTLGRVVGDLEGTGTGTGRGELCARAKRGITMSMGPGGPTNQPGGDRGLL